VKSEAKPKRVVVALVDFNTSKQQVNLVGDTTLQKLEEAGFFWTFERIPLAERVRIPGKGSILTPAMTAFTSGILVGLLVEF